MDDADLLRNYVETGSGSAFSQVVERHMALVYHSALRRAGDRTDLAKDITQQVFVAMAHQAKPLSKHESISGWLFTATRYIANQTMRAETRRRARELAAHAMDTADLAPSPPWTELRPVLDGALDKLSASDREAILLRFFQEKPLPQVATALGISEQAAQKRVRRALDRLRAVLARKGIKSTGEALGVLLAAKAAAAVPSGLAASISTGISALVTAGMASSLSWSFLALMNNTQLTVAAAIVTGVLLVAGTGMLSYQVSQRHQAEAALLSAQTHYAQAVERQNAAQAAIDRENERMAAAANIAAEKARLAAAAKKAGAGGRNATENRAGRFDANGLFIGEPTTEDGKQFAKRFFADHPEAYQMQLEGNRVYQQRHWAGFIASAGLSESQAAQLVDLAAHDLADNLSIGPDGHEVTDGALTDQQAQGLLSADQYQQYKTYAQFGRFQDIASNVALQIGFNSSSLLSADQVNQLANVMAKNSTAWGTDTTIVNTGPALASVNWDNTLAQAQAIFTPEQWQAAGPALTMYQFVSTVQKAAATPIKP